MKVRSLRTWILGLVAAVGMAGCAGPGAATGGFTHELKELEGVQLHYVTAGSGDSAVVLLHGWPQTWYEWRKIIPALATHHRVIVPDLRGLGDSSRPPTGYDKN